MFNIELVDDEGTAIECTLWNELAQQWFDRLQVDRVYYVSNGSLKPADKRYSTVRNNYSMSLSGGRASIEEAEDQASASKMSARLQYVMFNDLPVYINNRASVDLLGVLTGCQPLGSIKRKTDQTELNRRDITLVDSSRRQVTVTLWGDLATGVGAELEAQQASRPIVSVSAVRVGDYNGLSLSTLTRSIITISPENADAAKLREWYDAEGQQGEFVAANEGLPGSGRASGGERAAVRPISFASDLTKGAIDRDSKPEYHAMYLRIVDIPEGQTLYYLAAKDGKNHKVVPEGGDTFRCNATGQIYDSTQVARRYIMATKARGALPLATGGVSRSEPLPSPAPWCCRSRTPRAP